MSETTSPLKENMPGLADVKKLLAVSSCKGGVGKSTTAVNLAWSLAANGQKVGLFDADVYGPSLPTMVRPEDDTVYQDNGLIIPLEVDGVKLMSFGYLPTEHKNQAAIMRGPMVTQIISQLLGQTEWGELDVLVIDYPPGTGDIQLTLSQIANLDGALIVTTPQELSFVDVVKGITLFDKMKVPTLGVLENMSYYEHNGEKIRLFGQGAREKLVEEYGMTGSFEVPVEPELSRLGDNGKPFVAEHPDHPITALYKEVATFVTNELAAREEGVPVLGYNVGDDMILSLPDGSELAFAPIDLRLICQCAVCVDEMTGERKIHREDLDPELYPTNIAPTGNYAAAVEWSDGTTSCIFPFDRIVEAFGSE